MVEQLERPEPPPSHYAPVGAPSARGRPSVAIPDVKVTGRDRLRWVALAAIPAGLLSAVTNLITTDLISAPLLWVIPLAVYLASFVIAFSARGRRVVPLFVALTPATLTLLWVPIGSAAGWPILPLLLIEYAGLGIVAVALHGRLADLRPDARHLTEFYLVMSAGGALGGAFVALIAPVLFDGVWEYPILIAGALIVLAVTSPPRPARRPIRALLSGAPVRLIPYLAVSLPLLAYMASTDALAYEAATRWVLVGGLVLLFGGEPRFLAITTTTVLVLATFVLAPPTLFRDRSFFGVTEVTRNDVTTTLMHGTTVHGQQWLDPARREDPGNYYARSGPVGDIFAAWGRRPPGAVRVMGLGAGTLAVYARPEDDLAFYEIDPLVAQVASDPAFFTYLSDRVPPAEIRIGDGRLLLADEADDSLGLVIMDAFSSDAVPAHLLTAEALADADRALREDGILAVHVSNRYYDLGPPVAAALRGPGPHRPGAPVRPDPRGGRRRRRPGPLRRGHTRPSGGRGAAGPRLGPRPPRHGAADGRLPGPAPLPGPLSGSVALEDLQPVAHGGSSGIDDAHGQLQHAVRTADQPHDARPGAQPPVHGLHAAGAVHLGLGHEDGIDREAHEHHVDPVAGRQPEAVPGGQRGTAHEAHELAPERARGLQPLDQHGPAVEVAGEAAPGAGRTSAPRSAGDPAPPGTGSRAGAGAHAGPTWRRGR